MWEEQHTTGSALITYGAGKSKPELRGLKMFTVSVGRQRSLHVEHCSGTVTRAGGAPAGSARGGGRLPAARDALGVP